jgi:phosphoesterase RecJ-like protein
MMKPLEELFPLLTEPRRVVITTHQKPDADAMGASLALKHFLVQLGHTVTIISPTNWAGWVNWMPGVNEVMDYEMDKAKAKRSWIKQNGCSVLISIFFTGPKR